MSKLTYAHFSVPGHPSCRDCRHYTVYQPRNHKGVPEGAPKIWCAKAAKFVAAKIHDGVPVGLGSPASDHVGCKYWDCKP